MDIKTYIPTSPNLELSELLREKYGNNKNFDYFLSDFTKAFDFCVDNENILFFPITGTEEGHLRSHVALIIDKRLPIGEAFFGFLELPDNITIFDSMWKSLIEEAKKRGISTLKGPVNGSIWHQYRCLKETDNSEFFKMELFCEKYYYDLLNSKNPTTEILYYSASREKYDIVLKLIGENSYNKLEAAGFSIKPVKPVTPQQMETVANISRTVFSANWGYVELNEQEFTHLYSSDKLSAYLNTLYLLYKDEKIIGFCSTSNEDDTTLILKTICILPQYQGVGLGNALAYKIHFDAKKDSFKKIIYALIREGNDIKKFPKEEAVVFRRYAAFEFRI